MNNVLIKVEIILVIIHYSLVGTIPAVTTASERFELNMCILHCFLIF
ncbi:hypothetical protein [uncultured Clostridium sp.]|nr:hypothetical protein [uncultured Clostridium sp.]